MCFSYGTYVSGLGLSAWKTKILGVCPAVSEWPSLLESSNKTVLSLWNPLKLLQGTHISHIVVHAEKKGSGNRPTSRSRSSNRSRCGHRQQNRRGAYPPPIRAARRQKRDTMTVDRKQGNRCTKAMEPKRTAPQSGENSTPS